MRKPENLVRIRTSYDENGRLVMSLAKDEENERACTGSYTKEPGVIPPENIVEEDLGDGRFIPTKEFEWDVVNYKLATLYEPGTNQKTGYTGYILTPDEGRVSTTIAALGEDFTLQKPKYQPKCLPGDGALYVTDWQDAAASLAEGNPTKLDVQKEAYARWQKRMEAIERMPGGRNACQEEAGLRTLMHNQSITNRDEGLWVLGEINEMYEADMAGKKIDDFVRAVNELSGKQEAEMSL